MLKKIALGAAGLFFLMAGLEVGATRAYANKVDCGKVMSEVAAGKKAKEIAKDLSISPSSVYRCKKKAKAGTSPAAAEASPAAGANTAAEESTAAKMKVKKHIKSKSAPAASPASAASPGM